MNKNEHIYEVSPEFQRYWESVCNEPHKALMEKMQAWNAWQEVSKKLKKAEQAIETVAMYARINHDKPKDYGEIVADYISEHMPESRENKRK